MVSATCCGTVAFTHRILAWDELMVAGMVAVGFLGEAGRCVAGFAFVEERGCLLVVGSKFMLIQTTRLLLYLCCACTSFLR